MTILNDLDMPRWVFNLIPAKIYFISVAIFLLQMLINKYFKIKQSIAQTLVNCFSHYIGVYIVQVILKKYHLPTFSNFYDLKEFWQQNYLIAAGVYIFLNDFNVYIFHRLMHYHPLLWALHEVHHSSSELNLTTSIRSGWLVRIFHKFTDWPYIILMAYLDLDPYKLIPATASYVMFHQVVTHVGWTYKNKYLSKIFILPGDHAKHHEVIGPQGKSCNFGTMLSVFDHLFGSYDGSPNTKVYGCRAQYSESNMIEMQFRPVINAYKLLKSRPTFLDKMRLIFLGKLA